MPQPTQSDVHVNAVLTQISIAFLQERSHFAASSVFPNIPVQKQSDRYYTYDRGEFNRDEAQLRALSTESAGGGYTVDNTPTYFADVYAFHKDIDDQVRANADSVINLDREATEYVTHKMLIKREKDFMDTYFTTGVWTTEVTGVSGPPGGGQFQRWDEAASTPIEDIRAAGTAVLKETGFYPNTLLLGREVFDALIDHPDIIDRIKYGQTHPGAAVGGMTPLEQIFSPDPRMPGGRMRIVVSNAIENTAPKGATNVHDFIAGKKALLCYSAPNPGLMVPSAGYTFNWTGLLGSGNEGNRILKFRMTEKMSDRVEAHMAFDHKLVAADLGYFFETAVS